MADPTPYKRSYSFTNAQEDDPAAPLPGTRIDVELDNIAEASKTLTKTVNAGFRIEADLGAVVQVAEELDKVVFVADNMPDVRGAADAAPYAERAVRLFLGAFASDPSEGPLGQEITVGATYYNTIVGQSFVYSGPSSGWVPVAQVSIGGVLQGSMVAGEGQTVFGIGDYVSITVALNGQVLRPGIDFTTNPPDVIIPGAIAGDVVTWFGILKGSVSDAAVITRDTILTVAGQTRYSTSSTGQPLNLTQTNHVIFGPSPYGPLTYGVDYEVEDGDLVLAFTPDDGELMHRISMPRFTNSEAQVILQDFEDRVREDADRAAASAPFSTYAEALAAPKPAPLTRISWITGLQEFSVIRDPAGTCLGGGWSPNGDAYPEHWGAVGNGVVDDWAPMQAGVDFVKSNGGTFRGRGGAAYRYTDTLDASLPLGNTTRWIMDFSTCRLIQKIEGHDRVGVDFSRDGARAGGACWLVGARFENAPGVVSPAIMLDTSGTANMHIDELNFAGSANTQLRADSMYNNRLGRVTAYYGGRHFPYRNASGVTFSIASGSNTLTASVAHFQPGDVGRRITPRRSSDGRTETFIIQAYVSATQVTVTRASTATLTAAPGNWEGARISVTGNTATIIGEPWPDNAVGLSIYIEGAAANGNPQRRTITTRNSGTSVTLNAAVDTNVTDVRFTMTALDFGSSLDYAGAAAPNKETNFVTIGELFSENCRGVSMVVDDAANFNISNGKIHGEAQPDGNTAATTNHAWFIECQGGYEGTLEAGNVGGAKIVVFGNPGKLHFDNHTRVMLATGQKLVEHVNPQTGGVVEFESVECIGSVNAVNELRDEALQSGGRTIIGSISQAGVAPVFMPKRPQGVATINANAQFFLNWGWDEPNIIIDTTALTADRPRDLAGGQQLPGDTFKIVHKGTGGSLIVRDFASLTTLRILAPGSSGEFAWTGTAWIDIT